MDKLNISCMEVLYDHLTLDDQTKFINKLIGGKIWFVDLDHYGNSNKYYIIAETETDLFHKLSKVETLRNDFRNFGEIDVFHSKYMPLTLSHEHICRVCDSKVCHHFKSDTVHTLNDEEWFRLIKHVFNEKDSYRCKNLSCLST